MDQFIKYKIRLNGGFYICNKGISFGFSLNGAFILIATSIFILLLGFLFFLTIKNRPGDKILLFGLSMALGGAFSNWIDRFTQGCVIDFMVIHPYFFPVFNLADIFIFSGCTLLVYKLFHKNTL